METLGELFRAHFLTAHCGVCGHSSEIQSGPLLVTLGPDYRIDRLVARLRCQRCSAKEVQIRISWSGMREYRYGGER